MRVKSVSSWLTTVLLASQLLVSADKDSELKRITQHEWDKLDSLLKGRVILENSPLYEKEYGLWAATFDNVRPLALIQCSNTDDVMESMKFIQHHRDYLSRIGGFRVRSCGHSLVGDSTTIGVVIDVSGLSEIKLLGNPDNGERVELGPGVDLQTFSEFAYRHGITIPHGTCSSVCFGGFVLGGGFGMTSRRFGLASDLLHSVSIVLADSSLVSVSRHTSNDPEKDFGDLFWALQGAGQGNFGVVTKLTLTVPKKQPQTQPSVNNVPGNGLFVHLKWQYSQSVLSAVRSAWESWVTRPWFSVYLMVSPNYWISRQYSVELYGFWTSDPTEGYRMVSDIVSKVGSVSTPYWSDVSVKPFEGWLESSNENRLDYASHCLSRFSVNKQVEFEMWDLIADKVIQKAQSYTTRVEDVAKIDEIRKAMVNNAAKRKHNSHHNRHRHHKKNSKSSTNDANNGDGDSDGTSHGPSYEEYKPTKEEQKRVLEIIDELGSIKDDGESDPFQELAQDESQQWILDEVLDFAWIHYNFPSVHMFLAPAGGAIGTGQVLYPTVSDDDHDNNDHDNSERDGSESLTTKLKSDHTAFPWRDSEYLFVGCVRYMSELQGVFDYSEDIMVEWRRILDEHFGKSSFINFPDSSMKLSEINQRYFGSNYERLKKIKQKYDPSGLFENGLGVTVIGTSELDEQLIRTRNRWEPDNPKIYMSDSQWQREEWLERHRNDVTDYDEVGVVETGKNVAPIEVLTNEEAEELTIEEEQEEEEEEEEEQEWKQKQKRKKRRNARGFGVFIIVVLILGLCGFAINRYVCGKYLDWDDFPVLKDLFGTYGIFGPRAGSDAGHSSILHGGSNHVSSEAGSPSKSSILRGGGYSTYTQISTAEA